jgi:hypothetical protein
MIAMSTRAKTDARTQPRRAEKSSGWLGSDIYRRTAAGDDLVPFGRPMEEAPFTQSTDAERLRRRRPKPPEPYRGIIRVWGDFTGYRPPSQTSWSKPAGSVRGRCRGRPAHIARPSRTASGFCGVQTGDGERSGYFGTLNQKHSAVRR